MWVSAIGSIQWNSGFVKLTGGNANVYCILNGVKKFSYGETAANTNFEKGSVGQKYIC